VNLQCFT